MVRFSIYDRDNKEIKALFMIRKATDRSSSQHRFMYETLSATKLADMNLLVDVALNKSMPFYQYYELALLADNERENITRKVELVEDLMVTFFKGIQAENYYRRSVNVLLHSLYFPAIYHWMKILGRRNVMIIQAEALKEKNALSETLLGIHR